MTNQTNQNQIPGVPVGAKLVKIGNLERGIPYVGFGGEILIADKGTYNAANFAIVQPDNPYNKFLHEVKADISAAGETLADGDNYRVAKVGDRVWVTYDKAENWLGSGPDSVGPRFILKPKTRKVLVARHEIDEHGDVYLPEMGKIVANALVLEYPNTYRIEEHPL